MSETKINEYQGWDVQANSAKRIEKQSKETVIKRPPDADRLSEERDDGF